MTEEYELKIKNSQEELSIRNEIIKKMQEQYNKLKSDSDNEIKELKDLL